MTMNMLASLARGLRPPPDALKQYVDNIISKYTWNMENVVTIAFIVAILFSIVKFIEIKFLSDHPEEIKPLKYFVRDVVIVFGCACVGAFVFFQMNGGLGELMNVITDTKVIQNGSPQIFTDQPGF